MASLEDRYVQREGRIALSGIQALVRVMLDVRRRDAELGVDTGGFVSGYQGSPLGGLDQELVRARRHLDAEGIVFRPGLNEELAATSVAGTQLLGSLDGRRHEGVAAWWFGKSPGFDRAADAVRHGNLTGTAPLGGATAIVGDDPASKSSTVPSSCEPMCRSLVVPVLAPGDVGELLEAGLHATALSRHSGLWSAIKVVADLADATATVDVTGMHDRVPRLPTRAAHEPPVLLPPANLDAEADQLGARLDAARAYARAARLNRVVHEPARPRVAVVGAGLGFQAVLRALDDLGLGTPEALDALGLRLVRLMMPWPLDRAELHAQLAGVHTVLVVEDKLPFLEPLVRDALYRVADAPLVLGKEDAAGRPLLSLRSALGADDVARALGRVLEPADLPERALRHLDHLEEVLRPATAAPLPARTPYFCSGCPHNTSTRADADQLVGVGIGCHTMVAIDGGDRRGKLLGMPQMGGEGAQWIGLEPFCDEEHFVQNLGDGTFHHSGSLAIRAAVAAGAHITYRLLYNDAVAMTGGQTAVGRLSVEDLTRWLELEGVARTIVTSPEPGTYRGRTLAASASVRHRDDLQDAQRELAGVDGVTVLIHDDRCATEERRMRKRGELEAPREKVWINERVCEGCGDCGEKSTCLSVQPVPTELGRKTRIHQASCNQDLSCLKGDCPSFVLVTPATTEGPEGRRHAPPGPPPVVLRDPTARTGRDVLVRMPGVGGTGVVTISRVLQTAAHLDGRWAAGVDQIGLAQKGGPVVSDLRIADAPVAGQLRASTRGADVLLGFDLLGAADPATLAVCDPERTRAVIDTTRTPTAAMVTDTTRTFPPVRRALERIEARTAPGELLAFDATELAERLFGDHVQANMLLVGAAFQHGCLPLTASAIEEAIRLNRAGVEQNLAAFAWGRAMALDADAVLAATAPAPAAQRAAPRSDPRAVALVRAAGLDHGELGRIATHRAGELIAHSSERVAADYVEEVARVAALEAARTSGADLPVAQAHAHALHKLLAYKDEYEVARLHLDTIEQARLQDEFGPDAKVRIMLQPPLLRSLGMERKIALGAWFTPALRGLTHLKRLRGTPLDPFGRAAVRRVERALPAEHVAAVDAALAHLRPATVALVVALAESPDLVRGYEDVKLRGVAAWRARRVELMAELEAAPEVAALPTPAFALPVLRA